MGKIINVTDLKKTYSTFEQAHGFSSLLKGFFHRKTKLIEAITGLTFSVDEGELIGLIGPNGAGKSTTIKMLCGILHPSSGTAKIIFQDKQFIPWKHRSEFVKHIGVVFGQKSQLWSDLPPIDTFHLNKALFEIPSKDFDRRLDYFTKLLDVKDVIDRP
ncbi:MAG: ATP-binding cassette domain-containing protein, partial [Nanoarchaeota archaeon]